MTRGLLAVCWAMPPLVYPRAIQVSRTLKELSRRGWSIEVIALDARSNGSAEKDQAFAQHYDGFYRLYPVDPSRTIASENRWWRRNAYLRPMFPADASERAWTRLALRRASAIIKAKRLQAFVTFAQPWSDHLVGLALKKRFRSLPWIAHFSDPWVDSPYLKNADADALKRWRRQEQEVIRNTDAVVFVNEQTAELVMSKYPAEWRRKIAIVSHGFDPDLLKVLPTSRVAGNHLRFVSVGSMFEGREPFELLEAIALLKGMIAPELIPTFEVVGSSDSRYPERARQLGLDRIVSFGARTPYLNSLRIASEADILVVIDTHAVGSVFFPSKVVDYLMFGKPVLALTPPGGALAEVLEPLGHVCVDAGNPALIAEAIADVVRRYSQVCAMVESRRSQAENYSISTTTKLLEAAIVGAVERRENQSVA